MTNKTLWIDNSDGLLQVADRGFLVRNSHETKGWTRYFLRNNPPKTSRSFEARPYGWCGTCDSIATFGEGVWEVTKLAKNGRVQLTEITDAETLAEFLDEFGYPELLDDLLEHIHDAVAH